MADGVTGDIMNEEAIGMDIVDCLVISGLALFSLYYFVYRDYKSKQLSSFTQYSQNVEFKTNGSGSSVNGFAGAKSGIASGGAKSAPVDRSFVGRMKSSDKTCIVFYGSQTGTAEEFANRLVSEANAVGFAAMSADLEEYPMEDLERLSEVEDAFVVFCMATYGEGDPTDNAIDFIDWLKEDAESADLSGVKYTVFGLGNKTYEHYQAMGRLVDEKLDACGAERLYIRGEGDDDANIEDDFDSWKKDLWPSICSRFGKHYESAASSKLSRQYLLKEYGVDGLEKDQVYTGQHVKVVAPKNGTIPRISKPNASSFDSKNPYMATISVNRELFRGNAVERDGRSCLHVEFDIKGSGMRYEAGDHIAVFPKNDENLVNALGKRLGIDLDTIFMLENSDPSNSKLPFPCPCTYRTALTHYLDIAMVPKHHFLTSLVDYCTDDTEKEFMQKLTSDEGKSLFGQWIHKEQRDILQVLNDLKSLKPPIDHFIELLPRLQVRYYSISSSGKVYPDKVHVTAVVVKYTTPKGRVAKGVCTNYLANLVPKEGKVIRAPVYIRKSTFRLPKSASKPVVMIGPGTGLAPFRGFIQERALEREELAQLNDLESYGETILYFGCRNREEDYLYREELEKYESEGVLTEMCVAFSREQKEKVYVTHLLGKPENRDKLWSCIQKGGHIYVCGDAANMAKDVHKLLRDVVMKKSDRTEAEAEKFIKQLQTKGRYMQDVWG
eukprot:Nk52_evm88s1737 gene=Nk52_evmTU88s1737